MRPAPRRAAAGPGHPSARPPRAERALRAPWATAGRRAQGIGSSAPGSLPKMASRRVAHSASASPGSSAGPSGSSPRAVCSRRDPTQMSRAASNGVKGGSPTEPRSRQARIRALIVSSPAAWMARPLALVVLLCVIPFWTSYPPFGRCPRNRIKPNCGRVFNLGLLMRQLTGIGTPRSLQGRAAAPLGALIDLLSRLWRRRWRAAALDPSDRSFDDPITRHHEHMDLDLRRGAFTTGC